MLLYHFVASTLRGKTLKSPTKIYNISSDKEWGV